MERLFPQDLGNAPVESLDHAIGLWSAHGRQSMLDFERLTALVEDMVPRRPAFLASKQPIREFLAIVREDGADTKGCSGV